MTNTKYTGWFICDAHLILGIRTYETLLRRTKKGIPKYALQFDTKRDAELELHMMREYGSWPLFAPNARVEQIEWS